MVFLIFNLHFNKYLPVGRWSSLCILTLQKYQLQYKNVHNDKYMKYNYNI